MLKANGGHSNVMLVRLENGRRVLQDNEVEKVSSAVIGKAGLDGCMTAS